MSYKKLRSTIIGIIAMVVFACFIWGGKISVDAADTEIDEVELGILDIEKGYEISEFSYAEKRYGFTSSGWNSGKYKNKYDLTGENDSTDVKASPYTRHGISLTYYQNGNEYALHIGDKVSESAEYIIYNLTLKAADGYTFPSDISKYKLVGGYGEIRRVIEERHSNGKKVNVEIWVKAFKFAEAIRIDGINCPTEGYTPQYVGMTMATKNSFDAGHINLVNDWNPTSTSSVYTQNGVFWYEVNEDKTLSALRCNDKFIRNHKYRMQFCVAADENIRFYGREIDANGDFVRSLSTPIEINGLDYSVDDYSAWYDGEDRWGLKTVVVSITFECKGAITEIFMDGIKNPSDGAVADYDSVKVDTYYLDSTVDHDLSGDIDNDGVYEYKNGVQWGEIVDNKEVPFSYIDKNKFIKGHKYYLKVVMKTGFKYGYSKDPKEYKIYINDYRDDLVIVKESEFNERYIQLIKYFVPQDTVEDINFNMPVIAIGGYIKDAKVQLSSSIPNAFKDEKYGRYSDWMVSEDGTNYIKVENEDAVFEEGKYYKTRSVSNFKARIVSDYPKYKAQLEMLYLNEDVATAFSNNPVIRINDVEYSSINDVPEYYDYGQLKAIDISSATVTGIEDKEFTGSPIPQKFEVKLGDTVLVYEADYDVVYENNTNVGEAKLKIVGIGDYTGEITKTFKITEKKSDPKKDDPKKDDPKKDDPKKTEPTTTQPSSQNNTSQSKTTEQAPATDSKTVDGVGTISKDGKTLKDETGVTYNVAEKVTKTQLKKNAKIADKKSGGKYKITKITKKNGKVVGGTVEYLAPYNKNTKLISATGKVKLAGVTFTVTSIGNNCAKGCKKLTKVVIGENVTTIGKNAFNGCTKLKTIQIKSKKLKKVGANAFKGIYKKATISVPKTKKADYTKLLKGKGQAKTVKIK